MPKFSPNMPNHVFKIYVLSNPTYYPFEAVGASAAPAAAAVVTEFHAAEPVNGCIDVMGLAAVGPESRFAEESLDKRHLAGTARNSIPNLFKPVARTLRVQCPLVLNI